MIAAIIPGVFVTLLIYFGLCFLWGFCREVWGGWSWKTIGVMAAAALLASQAHPFRDNGRHR